VTDAVLMGSLHNYRRWLKELGLTERDPSKLRGVLAVGDDGKRLTLMGHSIAGKSRWMLCPISVCDLTHLLCGLSQECLPVSPSESH
jgi:hypothetical protein